MRSVRLGTGPRVSIGLPVYNGERFIGETLDSLLAQTYEEFELIICDNHSGDRTQEICRSYAAKDRRICYVRNPTNLGAAKNYRLTFELSSGEYFRWANCDDVFAPTSLERCVEVLNREQSVVLTYPRTKLIDESGQIISAYQDGLDLRSPKSSQRFKELHQKIGLVNAIYGLIRADVLRRTALVDAYIASDQPLTAELSLYGLFWEIPEYLFFRRIHSGAYSSQKDTRKLLEFYDPKIKDTVPLTRWRHLLAKITAVKRAPIGAAERADLFWFLVRSGVWDRERLIAELSIAARQRLRRLRCFSQ
jgi:glycosyltransferase involved in cell wall biosynthesis